MSSRLWWLLPVFILSLVIAARVSAASFIPPNAVQPSGNIAAPLNTSSTAQTKVGQLTVLGPTTVNGLTIGKVGGTSQICWNGTCQSDWNSIVTVTGFLRLVGSAPQDTGYAIIQGPSDPLPGSLYPSSAITGRARVPSATGPTYGLYGIAAQNPGDPTKTSTGVLGQATWNSALHAAIFATTKPGGVDNSARAYAGYLNGSVAVTANAASPTAFYDVYVGSSANTNGLAELCLGGVCRTQWPVVTGTGVWSLQTISQKVFLTPNTTTRNVALGGATSTSPIFVSVSQAAGVPTRADLTVAGTTKFEQYVVSTPTAGMPVSVTCGDGICNGSENDTWGSPNYCPQDCDFTAPVDVQYWDAITNCLPGPCNPSPPHLYLYWFGPQVFESPDYIGARVVIRTDRDPTGPFDTSYTAPGDGIFVPGADIPGTPGSVGAWGPSCNMNLPGGHYYHIGLYAYDAQRNYAPGYVVPGYCTDDNFPPPSQPPPPPPPPPGPSQDTT